ncbi:fibrillin-1-like isoform X2 [Cydia pomonella]|uniref:fibrillin-1-like isoform X2 n=1 Tax=Cydia pomonella TaxID=82600 RepID=UPI002ADE3362|nr:fibrillin-1-like isoform X2 [Cydia pomonella]
MKLVVLFVFCVSCLVGAQDEFADGDDVTETCCTHGADSALPLSSARECGTIGLPDYIEPEQEAACRASVASCCQDHFKQKDDCAAGAKYADSKRCSVPSTDIGKTCCEECKFGALTGESQGIEACGSSPTADVSPASYLRKTSYYKCCVEAATKPTTTEAPPTTSTEAVRHCEPASCRADQECDDSEGVIRCLCRSGFRKQKDGSCKDINECAESADNLCTQEDHVCHNTPGSYKCVPLKKREVAGCPPGFKKNVINQVCDDINECQLPRPPCPKYLCENTIGGFKCNGKPGTPAVEGATEAAPAELPARNDICPKGFRAGANDECVDIDECDEHLDDCQRLSQHCINTHGAFFCQDHVSKRCAPGFKVNSATGICEDINECEEGSEVCKRNQVCVNLPGAYDCKSKISTLPKLASKTCQEGTRMRVGSNKCDDIDECREGTHLCDQFQNCINTFGGHECRCKNGFELDSTSGSCEDVDECAMKLDNCGPGLHCLNVLGSFTCTRRAPTSSTTTTPAPTSNDYEYYYTDDEEPTNDTRNPGPPGPGSGGASKPSPKPNPPPPPPKATTTSTTTTSTTTTTTPKPTPTLKPTTTPRPPPPRPYRPPPTQYDPFGRPNTRPYTNRPRPNPTNPTPPETTTPNREGSRRPENRLPNSNVRPPTTPEVVEKEKNPDGGVELDTSEIPKDKWTNVIGKDKDNGPDDFDPNELHCLNGYEKNAAGDCVDIDECAGRHICSALETCKNEPGRYRCECITGFRRDPSGYCAVAPTIPTTSSTTTSTTTTTTTTTEAPRRYIPPQSRPQPRPQPSPQPRPQLRPQPQRPPQTPHFCEMGYIYDSRQGQCVDIDECATNRHTCVANERCVNVDGGFQCEKAPIYVPPTQNPPRPRPNSRDPHVITVGAQYGTRGPRYRRPTYSRVREVDAVMTSCQKGYRLTSDKMCLDIDECAVNQSECGPQQRCENFFGGHSCQCPAGHQLVGAKDCEDIDECQYGNPCSYSSKCVNTVGSFRCECNEGFRNARSNDKVCMDVDECTETPGICQQGCANAWGSYRCYCHQGYRMQEDGKTCVDVDECAEFAASASSRNRARLCGGECVNEPGSYRCSCPKGYRLSEDQHSCIDIDECETGEASCARSSDPSQVCQNTRGSYHCHTISCPAGYQLEAKHRCTRIQRTCAMSDWDCVHQPSSYSYNFITFVANIYLPLGRVDLFTMHGPAWADSFMSFEMRLVDVQAAPGVTPASLACFDTRPTGNMCVVSLLCALEGPQVAELELTMSLYQRRQFAGSAVARLVVIVSQYEY